MRLIGRGELDAPALVLDIEITVAPDGSRHETRGYRSAFCVVRRAGVPQALRFLDLAGADDVADVDVRRLVEVDLPRTETELEPPGPATGIDLTVAICTRDREDGLRRTLRSLALQNDTDFDVVVVDNAALCSLRVEELPTVGSSTRVVHEPTPGLSHARNRALAEVRTRHVAWIDDDEEADRTWVASVKAGFAVPSAPGVVSGLMLPAELATPAQVDFERYGGFNKGRTLQAAVLRAGDPSVPNTIYPLPNFGAGGNMAFQTDLLRSVGGFDPHLGAGTLTHGGEETLALSRCLDAGAVILHWPASVTWHYHRRTDEALTRQFYGYAAGLSAFYLSLLFTSLHYLPRILMLVPIGVRDLVLGSRSHEPETVLPTDFPSHLLRASRRGLLAGGFLYVRERVRQRRRAS